MAIDPIQSGNFLQQYRNANPSIGTATPAGGQQIANGLGGWFGNLFKSIGGNVSQNWNQATQNTQQAIAKPPQIQQAFPYQSSQVGGLTIPQSISNPQSNFSAYQGVLPKQTTPGANFETITGQNMQIPAFQASKPLSTPGIAPISQTATNPLGTSNTGFNPQQNNQQIVPTPPAGSVANAGNPQLTPTTLPSGMPGSYDAQGNFYASGNTNGANTVGIGSGVNSSFGGFGSGIVSPQSMQELQQYVDTINRMNALQGQLAQTQVPSATEIQAQNEANSAQNSLTQIQDTPQFYANNPNFANEGITTGQLQQEQSQQELPLSENLANFMLAKSIAGQQRQIAGLQLGAQVQGLGAQAQGIDQIRQATMFGGLPPDIASAILQKELFPPYQTFTNIAGMPGVVSEGPGGQFSSQIIGQPQGSMESQTQAPQGGLPQNVSVGSSDQQGQPTSLNVAGLPVQISYTADGRPYINSDKVDSRISDYTKSFAPSMGVPMLASDEVNKQQAIDVTSQNLQQLNSLLPSILKGGLYGRTIGALGNIASQYAQTNPDISAFNSYRDTAINTIQALAGGSGSGFRLNQAEINTATSNLPLITDNLETAQKKVSLLNGFLGKWENELLQTGQNPATNPTNLTTGGSQSSSSLYNF